MADKDIKDSAGKSADKPAELSDSQVEQVSGGLAAKPGTIYDRKGVKFE